VCVCVCVCVKVSGQIKDCIGKSRGQYTDAKY